MARQDPLQEQLASISALRRNPEGEASQKLLRASLASSKSVLAGRAATVIADMALAGFGPELEQAFPRFLSADRGCEAKTQIARALLVTDWMGSAVFLAGVTLVQMEGAYGPPVDTAAQLRAYSAMGLVQCRHPRALHHAVDLLVDKEPTARAGGIRALRGAAELGSTSALRLKARIGDEQPDVMRECFSALLALDPAASLSLIADSLRSRDEPLAEAAAFALSESNRYDALELLQQSLQMARGSDFRQVIYTAIATMRVEGAQAFVLAAAEQGDPAARAAAKALQLL